MKRFVYELHAVCNGDSQLIFAADSKIEAIKMIRELIPILLKELNRELVGSPYSIEGSHRWWAEQLRDCCFESHYKNVPGDRGGVDSVYSHETQRPFSDILSKLEEELCAIELGVLHIEY